MSLTILVVFESIGFRKNKTRLVKVKKAVVIFKIFSSLVILRDLLQNYLKVLVKNKRKMLITFNSVKYATYPLVRNLPLN